jgi:hypothetical protein
VVCNPCDDRRQHRRRQGRGVCPLPGGQDRDPERGDYYLTPDGEMAQAPGRWLANDDTLAALGIQPSEPVQGADFIAEANTICDPKYASFQALPPMEPTGIEPVTSCLQRRLDTSRLVAVVPRCLILRGFRDKAVLVRRGCFPHLLSSCLVPPDSCSAASWSRDLGSTRARDGLGSHFRTSAILVP